MKHSASQGVDTERLLQGPCMLGGNAHAYFPQPAAVLIAQQQNSVIQIRHYVLVIMQASTSWTNTSGGVLEALGPRSYEHQER